MNLIGSLKNPKVPQVANLLREKGHEVFDDWHAAGPEADDCWQAYAKNRQQSYVGALASPHARCIFEFDRRYLELADTVILMLPCGKSGHLELGWALGKGKRGFILLEGEPERYDVMYQLACGVFFNLEDLMEVL